MSEEFNILNEYVKLIDKGYCSDCNNLNCLGNFPSKDIAIAICKLQTENSSLKGKLQQKENIIKEVREYIEEWQKFPHTNGSTHKELKNLIEILDKNEVKKWEL